MCFGNGMDVLDMEITKTNLLKQLMNAITDDEWIELAQSRDLPISAFNRSVLLEMKTADANDGANAIQEAEVTGLHQVLKDYLEKHLCDKPDGWKGDVGYQLQLFDFLPVVIQYWEADDEFPTILNLFADKNMLQYMHYETVWFAVGHLMARLREEMESMA